RPHAPHRRSRWNTAAGDSSASLALLAGWCDMRGGVRSARRGTAHLSPAGRFLHQEPGIRHHRREDESWLRPESRAARGNYPDVALVPRAWLALERSPQARFEMADVPATRER